MRLRNLIKIAVVALAVLACAPKNPIYPAAEGLPGESDKAAVAAEHFPSRMHAFIWRNWGLVPESRLAEVLGTSGRNVRKVAESMGLDPRIEVDPVWLSSKGYITVLRRNWHLLPYDQILMLLDMTREELEWSLYEDDFLFVKLGRIKPHCERLVYEEPTPEMKARAKEIASVVRNIPSGEVRPRFDFFSSGMPEFHPGGPSTGLRDRPSTGLRNHPSDGLRMAFSYNAVYGDPLMDPEQSSYSEELLSRLASQGINAVWVHSVLRMLVPPGGLFPGDKDYKTRLDNLGTLVGRAAKYGIRVMMYVNEPRALPESWFDSDEKRGLIGVSEGDLRTFCTSDERVREWLSDSFESVFKAVPGLGGVFIISMSENLTNCASHHHEEDCPRCAGRPHDELIAEVNNAIASGVLKGNPDAKVLVWDWGWKDEYAGRIIDRLDKRCTLLSVSEWSLPIERGGVASRVGEYSISSVGPGPRALRHWEYASRAGLQTAAKVMVNASWELSSIPVIPAMDLIAAHARNLAARGVKDVMMTWSVGGYPSVNFAVFQRMLSDPEVRLDDIAAEYYGAKSGEAVREAWREFSEGFAEYPYHIRTLYNGPQQMGPANLLYPRPTSWKATMVGFPYDDLESWRSVYPPEVYILQNWKVADGFERGSEILMDALAAEDNPGVKALLEADLRRSGGIKCHFRSVANQAEFVLARDSGDKERAREAILSEMENVREFIPLADADPTFGYESSNHYFYIRQDLLEKLVNLEYVLANIEE